jgi:hypothetical protein
LHWKHRRNSFRNRENPGFYCWLQSLTGRPQHCVLAVVPYADRYEAEHQWTDLLRHSPGIELLNINSGARLEPGHLARMHAASKTAEARAKLSAANTGRKRGPETRSRISAGVTAWRARLRAEAT